MDIDFIKQAIKEVEAGEAVLLDVRRDDEWSAGHSELATHFDSARLFNDGELPDIDKNKKIYTYCVSGGRAGRVKMALLNHGFSKVENIGGLTHWYSAGGK